MLILNLHFISSFFIMLMSWRHTLELTPFLSSRHTCYMINYLMTKLKRYYRSTQRYYRLGLAVGSNIAFLHLLSGTSALDTGEVPLKTGCEAVLKRYPGRYFRLALSSFELFFKRYFRYAERYYRLWSWHSFWLFLHFWGLIPSHIILYIYCKYLAHIRSLSSVVN